MRPVRTFSGDRNRNQYPESRYFENTNHREGSYERNYPNYGRRQHMRSDMDKYPSGDAYYGGRSQSLDNRDYRRGYRSYSGSRFENTRSPDRYGYYHSNRYPSGTYYDERSGKDSRRSRFDDFDMYSRHGQEVGRQHGRHGFPDVNDERFRKDRYGYSDQSFSPRRFLSGDRFIESADRYGRENDRYGQGHNRYDQWYERYGPKSGRYGQDNDRFGYDYDRYGQGNDRFSQRYERFGPRNNQFGQINDRFGAYNDYQRYYGQGSDRYGQDYERYGQGFDRFGQASNRYGRGYQHYGQRSDGYGTSNLNDRDAYGRSFRSQDRFGKYDSRYERARFESSDRNRFGSGDRMRSGERPNEYDRDRYNSSYRKERSFSGGRRIDSGDRYDYRGDCFQNEGKVRFEMQSGGHRDRYDSYNPKNRRAMFPYQDQSDQAWIRRFRDEEYPFERKNQYRTDSSSNMNTRFQPTRAAYSPSNSDHRYRFQGGDNFQGGCLYGTQMDRDRMPPPIPPFSEPRSSMKSLGWSNNGDNRCINSRNSREMAVRTSYDLMRRRYYENSGDCSQNPTWLQRGGYGNAYNTLNISPDVLRVKFVDFHSRENAKTSRTFEYEVVHDVEQPCPVLRRGDTFRMTLCFSERDFDPSRDNIYLNFYTGANPSVPKRTRVVLLVSPETGKEFEKAPHQWDVRIMNMDGRNVEVEVFVPSTCSVGSWRCVLETAMKESVNARLQYRCFEEIYVLFNPFNRDDAVFIENDDQRYEYVLNDFGKVYTGGYRNVNGRSWIYGQFDDCVLPVACLMLEMAGLPSSERGNPIMVSKALASMISSSRQKHGLLQPTNGFDQDCGGQSPHLWTGSVQILEEYLMGGACSSVRYGESWVMAAVMTSLCRALGLPSRPVTAYVAALQTQGSLTVDRFVDQFGDIMAGGPGGDNNQSPYSTFYSSDWDSVDGVDDRVWVFHNWCDVWMRRSDAQQNKKNYSGWQATDPCGIIGRMAGVSADCYGPCPVEALRRGDVGHRHDVDAFYAALNSYVRYFYEDQESGWGYSPFRQFRYPVCRYILTKAVGRNDDNCGDDLSAGDDCDDLTNVYRDNERNDAEKVEVYNASRGVNVDSPSFLYQAASFNWGPFNPSACDTMNYDVSFELDSPARIMIGEPLTVPVVLNNSGGEERNLIVNICTRSSSYTGKLGPFLKKSSTQIPLAPNCQESVTLTVEPWEYMDKLADMSMVKITVTGFVKETGQSFVDEFDFRFNKPRMNIDVSEMKVGADCEATFTFNNPLDMPLTDCYLTMEVSGSVRPRTIRIDGDVPPRSVFTYTQNFTPRMPGSQRKLVASFISKQLKDVVGQRTVNVSDSGRRD